MCLGGVWKMINEIHMGERLKLEKQLLNGASWFFWIAALSVINTLIYIFGGSTNFIVGLGVTQLIDGFASAMAEGSGSNIPLIISFILDGFFILLFFILGHFSKKRKAWAFITGMVLYALDALIFIWATDMLSIGFHIFALVMIFNGFNANRKLREMPSAGIMQSENELVDNTDKAEDNNKYEGKEYTIQSPAVYKIIGWICMVFFFSITVLAALNGEIYPALALLAFGILGLVIILFTGKVTINNFGFKVKLPIGTYFIPWNEVEYVETGSGNMLIGGNDKKITFPAPEAWTGSDKYNAKDMFAAKLKERNLSVRQSFRATFPALKNAKIEG
jgi:hypothetical protein